MCPQVCKDTSLLAELVSVHEQGEDDELTSHQVGQSVDTGGNEGRKERTIFEHKTFRNKFITNYYIYELTK